MQDVKTKRILLFLAIIFFWFAQYVYVPYQTPYLYLLGAASSYVGIIVGAYGFTQMLLRIPVGVMADMNGRHKGLIAIGLICSALASVLRVLFPKPEMFLFANLLSGISSSMWICFTVFFSSLFNADEVGRSMGLVMAGNNGGVLLGFIAGMLLNDYIGIRSVFMASIAAGLIGLLFLLPIRTEVRAVQVHAAFRFGRVFKNKAIIFYSVLGILFQAVIMSTALSFTMSYAKTLTSQETVLGICSVIFIASSAAVSVLFSYLKKWTGPAATGALFLCLVLYCAFVPLSLGMWQLYILQAVAGIGNGGIMALLMAGVMTHAAPEMKSTAMGYFQGVYSLGMTFGPMLTGVLVGGGNYTAGFWAMGLVAALGAALALAGKKILNKPSNKKYEMNKTHNDIS